jgi:hypothetical protein
MKCPTEFSPLKNGILICGHCANKLDKYRELPIEVLNKNLLPPIVADVSIKNKSEKISILPQAVITKDIIKAKVNDIEVPLQCSNCKSFYFSYVVVKLLNIYSVYFL